MHIFMPFEYTSYEFFNYFSSMCSVIELMFSIPSICLHILRKFSIDIELAHNY